MRCYCTLQKFMQILRPWEILAFSATQPAVHGSAAEASSLFEALRGIEEIWLRKVSWKPLSRLPHRHSAAPATTPSQKKKHHRSCYQVSLKLERCFIPWGLGTNVSLTHFHAANKKMTSNHVSSIHRSCAEHSRRGRMMRMGAYLKPLQSK